MKNVFFFSAFFLLRVLCSFWLGSFFFFWHVARMTVCASVGVYCAWSSPREAFENFSMHSFHSTSRTMCKKLFSSHIEFSWRSRVQKGRCTLKLIHTCTHIQTREKQSRKGKKNEIAGEKLRLVRSDRKIFSRFRPVWFPEWEIFCDGLLINAIRENGEMASSVCVSPIMMPSSLIFANGLVHALMIAWSIKILVEELSGRMELSWRGFFLWGTKPSPKMSCRCFWLDAICLVPCSHDAKHLQHVLIRKF